MRIGLIDVDGHNFPNLPLMKISAHYKALGATVEPYEALTAHRDPYDIVFMSKVFDFTPDYQYPVYAREVVCGGTGCGASPESVLAAEIENAYPDYSLYPKYSEAYGFLTRGCPRGCEYCVVPGKEGRESHKVAELDMFWRGQKEIKLLDPNLLACKERIELLEQLAESRAYIDFTQGLDIRLMTDEVAELIMRCRIKVLHFAWDKEKDSAVICRRLREFKRQTGIDIRKAKVYILTNFNTDFEFDLYRVYELKSMNFDPYVMIYNKFRFVDERTGALRPTGQLLEQFTLEQIEHFKKVWRLQRWVNNKTIFRSGSAEKFEDYRVGRQIERS